MYQPSSSSSGSHGSMGPSGLARYGSAPESFLSAAADSVLGAGGGPTRDFSAVRSQQRHHNFYFSGSVDSASAESTCKPANPPYASESEDPKRVQQNRLERSYGSCMNQISGVGEAVSDIPNFKSGGGDGGCNLVRHRSSPAGFFINQLKPSTSTTTVAAAAAAAENGTGFSVPRGLGSSNSKGGVTRLNSQLSFTRQDSILSHISEEESENGIDGIDHTTNGHRKAVNSYASARYELCPWPNDSNAIVFSSPSSKRTKNINGGDVHSLNREESQLQFGFHQSALEMAAMDNLVHIPEDSVPCKIRAKRGCATHPRSIAERERRTRISGKLKKLQELVPNMDKQTSYADMLDLAVQHIKGLQNQVQKLNHELENCTCGCKQTT